MKKKFLSIFAIIISVFVISSCSEDFLEQPPVGALSDDVLGDSEGLRGVLIGCYSPLNDNGGFGGLGTSVQQWVRGDMRGQDLFKGSSLGDQEGLLAYSMWNLTPSSQGVEQAWTLSYNGVARCNALLRLLESINDPSVSDATKLQYEAEARFLRAHYYFLLKRDYDVVPFVDFTTNDARVPNTVENDGSTFIDIWPEIIADMQFAANNLPPTQNDLGRPNNWAAKAYLAKIYMYASQFPSATGVTYNNLGEALSLLNDVIANGQNAAGEKYALADNYLDNFQPDTENGPESVWAVQMSINDGTPSSGRGSNPNQMSWSQTRGIYRINESPTDGGGWGFWSPTPWLSNHFRTDENGLPYLEMWDDWDVVPLIGDDYRWNDELDGAYEPDTETPVDPRVDFTVARRGIDFIGWGPFPGAIWMREQSSSGPHLMVKYYATKEVHDAGGSYHVAGQTAWSGNYNVIRFAEVLLWAAELEVRVNGNTEKAREYVNMVRQRVIDNADSPRNRVQDGVANYQIDIYPAGHDAFSTNDKALEAILMELGLELGNEGRRFYDIVRFGEGERILNAAIDMLVDYGLAWIADGDYQDAKDMYMPIPTDAITNSLVEGVPTLTQAHY